MAESQARFLLGWRAWTLWFIPVLATLYFIWILLVALGTVKTPTVTIRMWVVGGMVVFGALLLVELLLLVRRGGKKASPEEEQASEDPGETVVPFQPPARASGPKIDAEIRATEEQYKGMRVLEVSIPPKSQNRGGVYAKSYVQVAPDLVLRIEDLVADRADLPQVAA